MRRADPSMTRGTSVSGDALGSRLARVRAWHGAGSPLRRGSERGERLLPPVLVVSWMVVLVAALFKLSEGHLYPVVAAMSFYACVLLWVAVAARGPVVLLGASVALYWIPVPGLFQGEVLSLLIIASPIVPLTLAWWLLTRTQAGPKSSPALDIALGLFVLSGFAELVMHGVSSFSSTRFFIAVLVPAVALFCCSRRVVGSDTAWRVVCVFLWSTTALCVLFVLGSVFGLAGMSETSGRFEGSFMVPMLGTIQFGAAILATNLAVACPLGFLAALSGIRSVRLAGVAFLVAVGLSIALTQGRGGMIGALVSSIVLLLLVARDRNPRVGRAVVAGVVMVSVFVALAIVLTGWYAPRSAVYAERYTGMIDSVVNGKLVAGVDNGRFKNWEYHARGLSQHPEGVGWVTTYDVYRPGQMPYPHNVFLLFGSALGLPGMTAYVLMLGVTGAVFLRGRRGASRDRRATGAAGLASLAALVVTGVSATTGVYDAYGAGVVWLTIGLEMLMLRSVTHADGGGRVSEGWRPHA